jgi:hypothetical protein
MKFVRSARLTAIIVANALCAGIAKFMVEALVGRRSWIADHK